MMPFMVFHTTKYHFSVTCDIHTLTFNSSKHSMSKQKSNLLQEHRQSKLFGCFHLVAKNRPSRVVLLPFRRSHHSLWQATHFLR